MKTYSVETKVRWSDLDANMHLANASYMNFTSFARIQYMSDLGISLENLKKWGIGPAILREKFSFFKEAHEGQDVVITVNQNGISERGEIFEFQHDLYDKATGNHLAHSRVLGVWFSMDQRKITIPPTEMLNKLNQSIDLDQVKVLTISDIKNLPVKPQNLNPETFKHARR